MRILRTMLVPVLALVGLMPLLGGCHDHDDRRAWDRDERRAYPAGYCYHRDEWDRDRGLGHHRGGDRDDWGGGGNVPENPGVAWGAQTRGAGGDRGVGPRRAQKGGG